MHYICATYLPLGYGKCDGNRPACATCKRLRVNCAYETDTSKTRSQALERKLSRLQSLLNDYHELLHLLRTAPYHDATGILQRLRAGSDVALILRFIRHGDLLLQLSAAPPIGSDTLSHTRPEMPRFPIDDGDSNSYLSTRLCETH
jgi:hypothetical protein